MSRSRRSPAATAGWSTIGSRNSSARAAAAGRPPTGSTSSSTTRSSASPSAATGRRPASGGSCARAINWCSWPTGRCCSTRPRDRTPASTSSLRICDGRGRADGRGAARRDRRQRHRRAARPVRDPDRRAAVKSDRRGIERLLDKPDPATRFYLFHGYDEGQSRAQAERLLKGLRGGQGCGGGGDRPVGPGDPGRRSRGDRHVRRAPGDLGRAGGRRDLRRGRGAARGAGGGEPGDRGGRWAAQDVEAAQAGRSAPAGARPRFL